MERIKAITKRVVVRISYAECMDRSKKTNSGEKDTTTRSTSSYCRGCKSQEVFNQILESKRPVGRPGTRWADKIQGDA